MGWKDAHIWKSSGIKNLKSLLGTSKRVLPCLLISENGVASIEHIPMSVGFACWEQMKAVWAVIQKLKISVEGMDEWVLPISERSYLPLDPLNRLETKDKATLWSLKEIARDKYHEARSRIEDENRKSVNAEMIKFIFILLTLIVISIFIVYLIKK